jgi:hypothetical protein
MDPKLHEDLLRYQVRMSAMQAAVALYCCHGDGGTPGMSAGELRENLSRLIELRDILLETALQPGPI